MRTLVIEQKMSGTGTIHDVASQHHDREIEFPKGHKYAVVFAAYYEGAECTTHKSAAAAAKESHRQSAFSHVVMDADGNQYQAWGDELTMV